MKKHGQKQHRLAIVAIVAGTLAVAAAAPRHDRYDRHDTVVLAVAPTTLANFSPNPHDAVDTAAIVVLTREAKARLASCGYTVITTDSTPATADEGSSYLFEHADIAAAWGAAHHADWVLVGRLNRFGTWEADWEMQVVSVPERRNTDTRVVELKGFGLDSGLTARLATRGAAWLIDQVTQSIAHASAGGSGAPVNARPCRA
jgi:hypothetical protein